MSAPVGRETPGRRAAAQRRKTEALGKRPSPVSAGGGTGFAAPLFIPVREVWSGDNQVQATGNFGANDWTIDTTYPGGGYVQNTLDGGYISWNVLLGPKGSIWSWLPMLGEGTDYGKVDFDIGTLPQSTFFADDAGSFQNAPNNWVTLETVDCYAAVGSVWRRPSTFQSFRIKGSAGDVGSALSAAGEWVYEWNGGPGPHRIRLRVNGKNPSSTGFRIRCSGLVLVQFDDSALP